MRHIKEDTLKNSSNDIPRHINEFDSPIDLTLYKTHWAVEHKLAENSDKTVFETIIRDYKRFFVDTRAYKVLCYYETVVFTDGTKLPTSFDAFTLRLL